MIKVAILLKQVDWFGDGGSAEKFSFADDTKMNLKLGSEGKPSTAEITLVNPIYQTLSTHTVIDCDHIKL